MLWRKPQAIISRRGDHPDRLFQLNLRKLLMHLLTENNESSVQNYAIVPTRLR